MEDAGRLRDRVLDLQRHFGLANADIEKILTSSDRIASRGRKIENLEFEDEAPAQVEGKSAPSPAPTPAAPPPAAPLPAPRAKPRVTRRNGGSGQPDLLARE
jgi:DNA recombination protein RmuC